MFFFKQKTAYEMRISDWSSDVCSSDLLRLIEEEAMKERTGRIIAQLPVDVGTYLLNEKRLAVREIEARYRTYVTLVPNPTLQKIGRASCRERVCKYV